MMSGNNSNGASAIVGSSSGSSGGKPPWLANTTTVWITKPNAKELKSVKESLKLKDLNETVEFFLDWWKKRDQLVELSYRNKVELETVKQNLACRDLNEAISRLIDSTNKVDIKILNVDGDRVPPELVVPGLKLIVEGEGKSESWKHTVDFAVASILSREEPVRYRFDSSGYREIRPPPTVPRSVSSMARAMSEPEAEALLQKVGVVSTVSATRTTTASKKKGSSQRR